ELRTRNSSPMQNQPNILLITCHDLGQHLGCYGVDTVNTPNLDALAQRGVRFTNSYSTSAVCSPGRGSLHTGRYPQSNGLLGLTHAPWWWRLNDDERHSAEIFGDLGYHTCLIGFHHIDPDWKRYGYHELRSPRVRADESVTAACDLINEAESFDRPFYAKVGFSEVHRPFRHGRDDSKGVFIPPWMQDTPAIREDLAEFQATIRQFDQYVGEILEALADSPIADNTLVVMTSDHGMPYPGAKWTVRKAGIEVPLILHQPGTALTGGKTFDPVISNVDVLPTLLDWIGAPIPDTMQGVSFRSVLAGDDESATPRTAAFAQYTPEMKRDNLSRSIITDRWHLIRYFDQGRTVDYPVEVVPKTFAAHEQRCKTKGARPFVQLFNLENDPYELCDVGDAPENADRVKDLSNQLLAWMRSVDDPLLHGPLKTPYYEQAMADFLADRQPDA
ncbi:MAG: sulfatase, partial [Verrucomicrobiota bacterium]